MENKIPEYAQSRNARPTGQVQEAPEEKAQVDDSYAIYDPESSDNTYDDQGYIIDSENEEEPAYNEEEPDY